MKVYSSLEQFNKPSAGCIVTVGNFDGVHRGHQAIITQAKTLAGRKSMVLVGMTFDPSALAVLFPEKASRFLMPLNMKIRLLNQFGLDHLIVVPAAKHLFSMTAEEFVRDILVNRLAMRHIVEGQTFNFGRRREGGIYTLKNLAPKYHYSVHETPSITLDMGDSQGAASNSAEHANSPVLPAEASPSVVISSTLIRNLIDDGRLDSAKRCLGRWYEIYGKIISGRGLGRQLGFPTANLQLFQKNQLIPGDGVYAGWVRLGDNFEDVWQSQTLHPAAVSIGRAETFADSDWQIEAHLLDYPPDGPSLCEKHILLAPVEKVRPLRKFESLDLLRLAIAQDCLKIKDSLSGSNLSCSG
jgi:riboflavin kinase / FMN adenylyltransferase